MHRQNIIRYLIVCLLCIICSSCAHMFFKDFAVVSVSYDTTGVYITFSDVVNPSTFKKAFAITENNSDFTGRLFFNSNKVTFVPDFQLKYGKKYEVTISTNAESSTGVSLLTDYRKEFQFHTDVSSPEVISVTPSSDEKYVSCDSPIVFTFSESVNVDSFKNAFTITPAVNYVVTANNDTSMISVTPCDIFELGKRYTVTVSTALEDVNGNGLLKDFSSSFTTGEDFLPPEFEVKTTKKLDYLINEGPVTVIDPDDGLTIVFSEAVDLSTIQSYISFSPAINVDYEQDLISQKELQIHFPSGIEWNTTYSMIVKPGISDLAGNTTEAASMFRFKNCNSKFMPPEVDAIYMQIDKDSSPNFKDQFRKYTSEDIYSEVLFNQSNFPTAEGNREREILCFFVFKVSPYSVYINPVSLFKGISLSSTNNCLSISQEEISDYITTEEHSLFSDYSNTDGFSYKFIKLRITVENTNSAGFIEISVSDVADNKGNKMVHPWTLILNKGI